MVGNIPVGNASVQTWTEPIGIIHVVEVVVPVDLRGADIDIFRPHIDSLKSKSVSESLCDVELRRVIDRIAIP